MATFIRRLINLGYLGFQRVSEVARFEGIRLADIYRTSDSFRSTYLAALQLIRDCDARRFARIKRHIAWIFNCKPPMVAAEYEVETRTCRVNFEEPVDDSDVALSIGLAARTLIHEATHGEIEARGIRYTPKHRARIERLCIIEEQRFLRQLGFSKPELATALRREFNESDWHVAWTATRWQRLLSILQGSSRE